MLPKSLKQELKESKEVELEKKEKEVKPKVGKSQKKK